MAITYVGSNTGMPSPVGDPYSIAIPASVQNDLVLVFTACTHPTLGGLPSTAGYTTIADFTLSGNLRFHVSYKFMGATPDTVVAFSGTGFSTIGAASVASVFHGVHTANLLDVAVVTATNSTGPTCPAITPTSNDCCVVIGCTCLVHDTSVGSVSNYLPSPTVQISRQVTGGNSISVAAGYRILSGGAATVEDPLSWSTWTNAGNCEVTIALRPLTASVDFITVDQATVTAAGKIIPLLETVPILKATIGYTGKTITVPDARVEAVFVDKYRIAYTGQPVNPADIQRAVTVTQASVLYRGRTVTPREIFFEDVPRYAVKGRGSGHWMETR